MPFTPVTKATFDGSAYDMMIYNLLRVVEKNSVIEMHHEEASSIIYQLQSSWGMPTDLYDRLISQYLVQPNAGVLSVKIPALKPMF
jgi:hypothetical protein